MSTKLYVGNLPFNADDSALRHNFSEYGDVTSAKVMMDRDTGRSKGFGFVEMETEEAAGKAITEFNGGELRGKAIVVSEAKEKKEGDGGRRPGSGSGFPRNPGRRGPR